MENSEILFERTLTDLGALQPAGQLKYLLEDTQNGGRRYGVRVMRLAQGQVEEACCGAVCATRRQCWILLRFLYENAVMPIHLENVVQDLCSQGLLEKMEQGNGCE